MFPFNLSREQSSSTVSEGGGLGNGEVQTMTEPRVLDKRLAPIHRRLCYRHVPYLREYMGLLY
jgi:hypothetical protein